MNKKIDIFLDSGAFSAMTQNKIIDIEEYISFVKENEQYLSLYANLDVIGDSKKTLENQKIMEEAGLHPLPCYHFGEDKKYLKYYVSNYDYIALGGMVGKRADILVNELNGLFSEYICDSEGIPKVKVHGFGLTSLRLMIRYPWYSVDSTSWVVTARMGSVYVPRYSNNSWIYDENSWKISLSSRSPDKKEAGAHITTLSPLQKRVIFDYFDEKGYKLGQSSFKTVSKGYELKENERWWGKEVEGHRDVEIIEERGLCNDYKLRDELNIIYFIDLEKHLPEWPWAFKMNNNRAGFSL